MLSQEKKIYHLRTTYGLAKGSPDPSTQLGALIVDPMGEVIGIGCNTFPRGVKNTPERLERPLKYNFIEHAERNAIFSALRNGSNTVGATMICPWFACADCGRAIINAGIKHVVGHKQRFELVNERWAESIAISFQMFEEAGVTTELIDIVNLNVAPVLADGKLWTP